VPWLSRRPSQYRFALGGTGRNSIRETTVLVCRAEPEAQVEVRRCRGPGVAAALSMAAEEAGRDQSRHVQRSV
jgi:hypothetical protein